MTDSLHRPALDLAGIPSESKTGYPAEFLARVAGRSRKRLGKALGLSDFGVNLTELQPGAQSALRHWHRHEDEFIFIVSGELTLITEAGEQTLRPGQCAGFPKNVPDGHHLVNRSKAVASFLEIGCNHPNEEAFYPDDDLHFKRSDGFFTRKDGSRAK
ncbi:MAG: cupin domain-containing protein [Alphaproteobacteria bacterium]|nr:cupin domain-containing protein [Alphaproteobacteria bacterium]